MYGENQFEEQTSKTDLLDILSLQMKYKNLFQHTSHSFIIYHKLMELLRTQKAERATHLPVVISTLVVALTSVEVVASEK